MDAARRAEPDHVGETDLGAFDLTGTGLAPQVMADLPDVGDTSGGDRMALRLQAARHVDGLAAIAERSTGLKSTAPPSSQSIRLS